MVEGHFKYRAFISYSHADVKWGEWLHRSLESYRIPKELVGTMGHHQPVPARLFPVYRDRDEAASAGDLGAEIQAALEQSSCLVVICSPDSAASRWVNEEIIFFKKLGHEKRILPFIVRGEPNAAHETHIDATRECFPNALKYQLGGDGSFTDQLAEPLAADARPQRDGKENAKLKLISGILGIGYDALKRRDEHATRRRARIYQAIAGAMALLAVLAASGGWLAYEQKLQAQHERDQTVRGELRLLTQAASDRLERSDVPSASNIILEVLSRRRSGQSWNAAAVNVFQESRALDRELMIMAGHRDFVVSAAWSHRADRIVTASFDNSARVWDGATGSELLRLSGHTDHLEWAAWSPDDSRIVTASDDGTARIWDATTGRQLIAGVKQAGAIECAAWSPDGTRIVTASSDHTARIWDAKLARQFAILAGHGDAVSTASWSADGKRIVTASYDGTARIWDANTGASLRTLSGHAGRVIWAAWSPDAKRIVTTSEDKTARIWNAVSGSLIAVLSGHGDLVSSAMYSPDGSRIATASYDKSIRLWDAATGAQLTALWGHNASVISAMWSPDGSHLVSASADKTARSWDIRSAGEISRLSGHTDAVLWAAYSPDSRRIVTSSNDKTARIWNSASGAQNALLTGHTGRVETAAWSPDGRQIATASDDKTIRIWDSFTSRPLGLLQGHTGMVVYAAWSPDGKRIASASFDRTSRIWNALTGKQLEVLSGHSGMVIGANWSPDGKRIVTASYDKTARIWDPLNGRQLITITGHDGNVYSAGWSPDGKRIATASVDKTSRIWDANSGRQLGVLQGHDSFVLSANYSPDGRHIATASYDKTARIWDADTGDQLAVLSGHTDVVNSVNWSPDGTRIVTASDDQTARIWNARVPGLETQLLWAHAAQIDPLSPIERDNLGLAPLRHGREFADRVTQCDLVAADPNDPDRVSSGVVLEQVAVDIAVAACPGFHSSPENRARFLYQLGRALLSRGDSVGARRDFESAYAAGYRAAGAALGDVFANPAYRTPDRSRARALYAKAAGTGVAIANFRLGELYEAGTAKRAPMTGESFLWFTRGAELGEPSALARFGEEYDEEAVVAKSAAERNARLLDAFRYYAAAAERARQEDWPDDAWKDWRYRRASLARLLARQGMMEQVASAYAADLSMWRGKQPTLRDRVWRWFHAGA